MLTIQIVDVKNRKAIWLGVVSTRPLPGDILALTFAPKEGETEPEVKRFQVMNATFLLTEDSSATQAVNIYATPLSESGIIAPGVG